MVAIYDRYAFGYLQTSNWRLPIIRFRKLLR